MQHTGRFKHSKPDAARTLKAFVKKGKNPNVYRSIITAAFGLYTAVKHERSIRRIIAFSGGILLGGAWADVRPVEMMLLLVVWGLVLTAEFLNTSLEKALDYASGKEYHPLIRQGKDYASASVFIVSVIAFVVSGMIFWESF